MLSQIGDMINHDWKDPTPPPVIEKPPSPPKPRKRRVKKKKVETPPEDVTPEPKKLAGSMMKKGPTEVEELEEKNAKLQEEI